MIVVDTNVVSEGTRSVPDSVVARWLVDHAGAPLWVTSTVVAEVLFGIAVMPAGRRRTTVERRMGLILKELFTERVLPFDGEAARAHAEIRATRRRAGRPISFPDAQIAAVCLVHDATLATRNTSDFEGCGIRVVDPWAVAD